MEHDLLRIPTGYQCQVCQWTWASKPATECPGCVRYGWGGQPENLKSLSGLHKKNLKPKPGSKPAGVVYLRRDFMWLYDEKECVLDDPELPPIVQWDSRRDLKTTGELRKLNLAPDLAKKPDAVAWVWDRDEEWGKWIPLYSENRCQWQAKDSWVTKSALKKAYLLSDGWIKKLGEPDRRLKNERWRNAAPIQLYSRQRVEAFLADNAEAYSAWIDKRDRCLAIFEQHKDKIFAKRNLKKEQAGRCLKCASGVATEKGFFCAVHPMGQENLPCPDWVERFMQLVKC